MKNKTTLIKNSLASAKSAFLKTLVNNNHFTGWRQFPSINDNQVGVFGTASGLISLCELAPDKNVEIKNIQNTLIKFQLEDGSWHSPTIIENVGLTTATCYCIIALLRSGFSSSNSSIIKGVNWLVDNINKDGGVGSYKKDTNSSILNSCLVLETFSLLDYNANKVNINLIVSWLLKQQLNNGGFGLPEGNLHHTSLSIISLSKFKSYILDINKHLKLAHDFIETNWEINQNLYKDIYYIETNSRRAMLYHTYFTDGLLLRAKLSKTMNYDNKLNELIEHLSATQNEGFWHHLTLPNKPASWATMEVVLGFSKIMRSIKKDPEFFELRTTVFELKNNIDNIQNDFKNVLSNNKELKLKIKKVYNFYRFRYIILSIYILSVYIFLRNSFNTNQYNDWIGFGISFVFFLIGVIISLNNDDG